MPTLWIVHREPRLRTELRRTTEPFAESFCDAPDAAAFGSAPTPDAVLLGLAGDWEAELAFAASVAPRLPGIPWILCGPAEAEARALRLFDSTPSHFLPSPVDPRRLAELFAQVPRAPFRASLSQRAERRRVSQRLSRWYQSEELPGMLRALDPALRDVPVLIRGEAGTGRYELVHYLHCFGGTQRGTLVELPCREATGSRDIADLLETAQRDPASAAGLAVWLRDVERLPAECQETLRAWIDAATVPGVPRIPFVRWIATTRDPGESPQPLAQLAERLGSLEIRLTALRERPDRVEAIAARCADSWCRSHRKSPRALDADALETLCAYPWPGNVLELERVIAHSLIASSEQTLRATDLQLAGRRLLDATPAQGTRAAPREEAGAISPADLRAEGSATHATPQREAAFADLADALAREIRDPLATLRTLATLDSEHFRDERFRERFAELAGDDLVGLDDRIEALEALANLPPRVREVLDFGQLLEEVLAAREARIRDQQLLVVREIEAELPPLQGDPTRMRVALETLLDCAVPPGQRGGDLYLAVRHLPASEGTGSIRLLLRSKQAPDETASAPRKPAAPGDLRLALAALLLEGQGARLTLGEPNGDERLMLVDLTLA